MSYGVVLTDGTATVDLRGPTIKCRDWSDLLGAPAKRGRNRPIPGQRGTVARPRVADELRVLLPVQVVASSHDACVEALEELYDLIDTDATLTVTVHRGTLDPISGTIQIEDPDRPEFQTAHIASLVIDATLPDGRLT